jgi:hypothetical protein
MTKASAVAVHDESKLVTRPPVPDPMMQMIEDAARDPSVDVSKMRELLAMKKEAMQDEARRVYFEQMNRVQAAILPIAADASNPQTKSKYASYAALDRVLRPIYTSHGFSLNFGTADGAPETFVRVTCDVAHSAGHVRPYHIDMPADGKGAKGGDVMTKTHATGSAVSYGRRYLLGMIFNLAIGNDDDGNAAGNRSVSEAQLTELNELAVALGVDIAAFCNHFEIGSLAEVPAAQFAKCKTAMMAKARKASSL